MLLQLSNSIVKLANSARSFKFLQKTGLENNKTLFFAKRNWMHTIDTVYKKLFIILKTSLWQQHMYYSTSIQQHAYLNTSITTLLSQHTYLKTHVSNSKLTNKQKGLLQLPYVKTTSYVLNSFNRIAC